MDGDTIARPTKNLFVDWGSAQDPMVALREAIGSLMRSRGVRVKEVLIHPTLIVRGFTFSVEYRNEWYYLINKTDFRRILASMPERHAVKFAESLWGIPVFEDEYKIGQVSCGIWYGSIKLGYFS